MKCKCSAVVVPAAAFLAGGVAGFYFRKRYIRTVLHVDLNNIDPIVVAFQSGTKVKWKGKDFSIQAVPGLVNGRYSPSGPFRKHPKEGKHGFWHADIFADAEGDDYFYVINQNSTKAGALAAAASVPIQAAIRPCPQCGATGLKGSVNVQGPASRTIPLSADPNTKMTAASPTDLPVTTNGSYTWKPAHGFNGDWTVTFEESPAGGQTVFDNKNPTCTITAGPRATPYIYHPQINGYNPGRASFTIGSSVAQPSASST